MVDDNQEKQFTHVIQNEGISTLFGAYIQGKAASFLSSSLVKKITDSQTGQDPNPSNLLIPDSGIFGRIVGYFQAKAASISGPSLIEKIDDSKTGQVPRRLDHNEFSNPTGESISPPIESQDRLANKAESRALEAIHDENIKKMMDIALRNLPTIDGGITPPAKNQPLQRTKLGIKKQMDGL